MLCVSKNNARIQKKVLEKYYLYQIILYICSVKQVKIILTTYKPSNYDNLSNKQHNGSS